MTDITQASAAPQPANFTATFTFKITGLRTQTINGIQNAVKQVEWILKGSESNQIFELPQTTEVPDPQADGFIPLQDLTEVEVISWIETHETRLPSIKAHIQYVLNKEVAKATLASAPMPWVPVIPESTPTPPEAPAP
jgi:hypothetical protein